MNYESYNYFLKNLTQEQVVAVMDALAFCIDNQYDLTAYTDNNMRIAHNAFAGICRTNGIAATDYALHTLCSMCRGEGCEDELCFGGAIE